MFKSSIHLNSVDKFTYLQFLLEGPASRSLAGLQLPAPEAIETLKKRFGNKQQIIHRNSDSLLDLEPVQSPSNTRAVWQGGISSMWSQVTECPTGFIWEHVVQNAGEQSATGNKTNC